MRVSTTINGQSRDLDFAPSQTLLELLRDGLYLTGTREGCGVGVCGSCTVLLDGKPVSSCLLLAFHIEGRDVLTIEGLAIDGELDPVQQAFLEYQAFQCGFCTPGMVLAVKALITEQPEPTDEAVRDYLSGNICRCGTYAEVLRAVRSLMDGSDQHPG